MPIHINLLAEAKAEEELRRRDPVKRAILIGAALVCLMFVWSGLLFLRIHAAKNDVSALDAQMGVQSKQYDDAMAQQKKVVDLTHRMGDLQRLSTNRFLWGSVLNALQQSVVNDVQLVSFRGEQSYTYTEEIKAKTNDFGKITQFPRAGGTTMRIRLQFDAKDSSPTPGDQVGKYKEAIASTAFFKAALGKTNEINLKYVSQPLLDGESGKTIVMFTLEGKLPEKILK